ncbi:MAG: putative sugar O-methyltransferase [Acidobacteria bacterium]|nr:putative sugar O-methyltransferase [Acidobacteriota bacterium]
MKGATDMAAVEPGPSPERLAARAVRVARREAERFALETVAATAYEHYGAVRDWARRMSETSGEIASLTEPERRTIAALSHLWDAAPETIATLRHWCEPISGVRAVDYDDPAGDLIARLRRDLAVLRKQLGQDLLVPEPQALGGFGYLRAGERYNADTLKHFHLLAALQDAAVLPEFRRTTGRRIVWEIGGGWGGFAYQFKTLCPDVTYLITGVPDLFLLSAVYLMTVYPGVRWRLFDPEAPDEVWREWERVDFVFAPESALPVLRPPRVDLTVDVLTLRHMSDERVSAHVHRAFEFGSRYFYSVLPGGDARDDTRRVWRAIEQRYWPHPMPARGEPGRAPDWAHLVGWRRLLA